jgi:hypothetical protein
MISFHILGKENIRVNSQPRVFIPILMWYESIHVNRRFDVEHGREHLIIDHLGKPLTSAMEITSDVNDSQGTLVQSNECE